MIDKSEVMHNIKTGSDTDLYLSRINTVQKLADGTKNPDFLKIKTAEAGFDFPYLTRTTGNSLKPTTEFIQSNELRHGGAESAPRPGNTSVEGSIDVELSPDTFDDNIAATFNNEWRRWKSDADSASNLDKVPCGDGKFLTRACKPGTEAGTYDEDSYNSNETFSPRRLINDGRTGSEDGLLVVPKGAVVNELTFGKKSIEYDVIKKYGGVAGEDMYHIFKRLAIGTLDFNAQIGSIVTGSFGIMGDSSSDILDTDEAKAYLGGNTSAKFEKGLKTGNEFIDELPEKAIGTDQFTTREGDLWINGKEITFGQTLAFNIDKNLQKKYALFVKNPISKTSQKKAITCNLDTYLVPDSKVLYNLANNNETFEVLFAFEDKGYMNDVKDDEHKPENLYLVQIFSAKAEDKDLTASGEDDYNMSIPLRSFGERLCRIFKIAVPKVKKAVATTVGSDHAVRLTPNVVLGVGDLIEYNASTAPNGMAVSVKVGDGAAEALTLNFGYETWHLTTSKPDNWATTYTSYYTKFGETYTPVSGTSAPTWEANKYYIGRLEDAKGNVKGDTDYVEPNVILDLKDDGSDGSYGKITVIPDLSGAASNANVVVTTKLGGKETACYFKNTSE